MSDEFGWRPRSVVHCASSIGVLVIAMCIGCNRNDDARKMELRSTDTIKLTMDSDYYTSVPPRDRPPDGTFPAGTVVSVMVHQDNKWAGGFFRGQEGVRGFFLVQTMDAQRYGTSLPLPRSLSSLSIAQISSLATGILLRA